MNIDTFIQELLSSINAYDIEAYLGKWHATAVLNDPSVGKVFRGHSEIREYFEDYFIGYQSQTRLVKLEILSENKAHIEVHFTGNFPGGQVGGIFDFTFKDGKISEATADLI